MAPQIANSPFGFFDLLDRAGEELFSVAQNNQWLFLDHIQEARDRILEFLAGGSARSRRMRFLMTDPEDNVGLRSWGRAGLRPVKEFRSDLIRCCTALQNLVLEAASAGLNLEAHLGSLTTLSITFVDPNTDPGFAVFAPNAVGTNAAARAVFFLSNADHARVVSEYHSAYEGMFARARPIQNWAAPKQVPRS